MSKSNLIGTVLKVDDRYIGTAEDYLNREIIPKVKAVIREYNSLESLPPFTRETWLQIIGDGGGTICESYRQQAEEDLKHFKNPSVRASAMQGIDQVLRPFQTAVEEAQNSQKAYGANPIVSLSLLDIEINDDGEPVANLDRVTEEATLKIETNAQAQLYECGKRAEGVLNELRGLLVDTNINPDRIGWGGTRMQSTIFNLTGEGATGKVEFVPRVIRFAKSDELVNA